MIIVFLLFGIGAHRAMTAAFGWPRENFQIRWHPLPHKE
jgi:hypothetical protein